MAQSAAPSKKADCAEVSRVPVTEVFSGLPAEPLQYTPEQRRFRTRIRGRFQGIRRLERQLGSTLSGVSGPNFAGHYYVIRWGCGSNCLMMAVVDASNGRVYGPPLRGSGTDELYVPMDPSGDVEVDFRRDSSLMVLRNACRTAQRECGVYYFNFQDNHFVLIRRSLVDLTKNSVFPGPGC